ncbi:MULTISPECIES: acetolactate synthase large subunit [unclassified Enterococcus]|uniref:acetolactate synthase large subunit n=1 Tax=unclassified Enterococcus TaxID=2608891 RepID=UPI001553BDF1|nr:MULTISPECIES: acetolactate synthase large subunit [unclassified Enterococcus]MBS7576326.1 acetolactate synthase large subunit [Enterococcus sp. MMGLQ5-2]MBS7583559.1 acetolactate synthase large subunit [Enterococcus sp. MMGLQ5-1]NPD11421.1 acetolactate synthase large subunit [Enterococcus sp. MMGLQ5-1]NPD36164.1 acetolactate synthase large subunit [Enterococcus sp. MMGLQ5-2]
MKKMKLDQPTSGSMLLLETLKKLGVEKIFGYPGGAVLPLYDAIYDFDIQHILARHEQGAVTAAEGYAKSTGKPGVAVVTSGPGATNAVTAIADAFSDSVPMIVFTGQVATPGIGKDAFQEADMVGITMPITKYNYQVRDTEDIPRIIMEAFHIATTGRKGPVVIDLPKNISVNQVSEINDTTIDIASYQPTTEPNGKQLRKIIDALAASKKPLILAGGGLNYAHAGQEFVDFVEKYQIPVVNTLLGLGSIPTTNPLFLGMGGMHGSYAANMALTECDFLINLGSRFDDRLASSPSTFAPEAKIAHIDIDPAEIGKIIRTQIPVVSDLKNALVELLKIEGQKPQNEDWVAHVSANKAKHPFKYAHSETEIKPQRVIEIIGKLTKGDAIIVTDVGQHQMWTAQFYPFKFPNQLVTSGGLGTMGFGIPAAIGAKLAHPEKEVVLFVGDGGFQMTNQELAILNIYNVPIKIVMLNNHSLGMVRQWQEAFFNERRSESVLDQQPDFQLLAKAYGINHVLLTDAQTIEKDLEVINDAGPAFIEVHIPFSEIVTPMVPAGKSNFEMLGVD